MFFNEQRIHRSLWIDTERDECHLSNLLRDDGVIDGLVWILAPREWTVVLNQHGRGVNGIDVIVEETVDNHHTCVMLVSRHLICCHSLRARNTVVEVISMCRADVGNVLAGLCPGSGIGGVGVYHTANFGERLLYYKVCGGVAGGVQVALNDFACFKVNDHHV